MATKVIIEKYGHCSNCASYTVTTTTPDGGVRTAESNDGGSEDEAIGRLVKQNPDIFGVEIEYEGRAKEEHDRIERIVRAALRPS